ncbi:hypothetical protein CC1G_14097 [Coprinopsis cinerea okayama7|uniref:Uncharacterized protein n=1 Tax=Coprinopsis cinerea (strain Okayama-7 / 130 / ATCC MYA-4618 / FGSC 9003) TaxID=240176 RepID=D6RLH9_COPC7|nr:hypothetical protein CC1G_14097 [Coprinopsis cinerea okayama7\|eukprot:XP_002911565.1 hypothetical protein CC1G_14097 [Coprinopsis cinerea okayama7\
MSILSTVLNYFSSKPRRPKWESYLLTFRGIGDQWHHLHIVPEYEGRDPQQHTRSPGASDGCANIPVQGQPSIVEQITVIASKDEPKFPAGVWCIASFETLGKLPVSLGTGAEQVVKEVLERLEENVKRALNIKSPLVQPGGGGTESSEAELVSGALERCREALVKGYWDTVAQIQEVEESSASGLGGEGQAEAPTVRLTQIWRHKPGRLCREQHET